MRLWVSYIALGLALFLAIFPPVSSGAADWSVIPSLSVSGAYSNNVNWAYINKMSDFTFSEAPGVSFNYTSDVGSLQGALSLNALQYVRETQYDNIDQNYSINGRYQLNPRLGLTMLGSYNVNSTLQTALSTTGLITTHIPQDYLTLAPGLTYALTERLTATMGYSYNQINSTSPIFINSTANQGTLTLSYPLSNQKTTIGGTVTGNETTYSDNDNSSQVGIYLNLGHQFSEVFNVNFSGGANYNSVHNTSAVSTATPPFLALTPQPGRQGSLSPYFNIGATRSWTNTSLSLNYLQNQPASGLGTPTSLNSVSVSLSHNFTELLSGSLAGSFSNSQPVNVSGNFETTVFQLIPSLTYKLTENLSLIPACNLGLLQESGRNANVVGASVMLTYVYPYLHYQK